MNKPNNKSNNKIDNILLSRKVIITCGTGGVGKTTLSAAMACRAALLGKKTVVITIDPAKRLATSLGMKGLGNTAFDLTPQIKKAFEEARKKNPELPKVFKGSLAAIVPDTRKTFEAFVHELAPNPGAADRVLRNPIFQIFAKEFSGTNEYMALERLLSLYKEGEYDCIILDTPPSRNTLSFLNAPKLLSQFFEEKLIRWLVLPANKLVSAGMRKALGLLESLTGAGFMTHLFEFAAALFEVQINFTASLKKVTALLESEEVGFMLVATPSPDTVHELQHFAEVLNEYGFHFDGIALNRTLGHLKINPEDDSAPLQVIRALQERERQVLKSLSICAKLPELARDVHSVEDLFHVATAFGPYSPQH